MFASKEFLQDICGLLGSKGVFVLLVDDKVKVPICVTAFLMKSDYQTM